MNFNGKDFNNIMKFLAIIGLVAFAVWITKNPACLIVLPFLKLWEE